MLQIASHFWRMCLLRAGPERLPSSNFATAFIFGIYLLISFVVVMMIRPKEPLGALVGTLAIGILYQAGVTFLLLMFKGVPGRFRATWSALLGTNALMLIILLPFNLIILKADSETLRDLADSATWVCLGWWLAIAGHIYHKSVDISILQGSAIAFLIELLGVMTAFYLFPRVA